MQPVTSIATAEEALRVFIPKTKKDHTYTLDGIKKLMDTLDNPQDKLKVIHVAGTSGKSSTCYFIAQLLVSQGLKVGLSISPHVDSITERAQINMASIYEEEYCLLFSEFLSLVNQSKTKPSYFEFLIAFAHWVFCKKRVDYAVIEVGLGGLLDSTNIVSRQDKICVITDIGLDHTGILGSTVEAITLQKAGIIKPNNTVFMNHQTNAIDKHVLYVCNKQNATLKFAKNQNFALKNLPQFQLRNLQLAFEVANYGSQKNLGHKLSYKSIKSADNLVIPARMEVL